VSSFAGWPFELSPGQDVIAAEGELDAAYESGDSGRIFWAETDVVEAYERAGMIEHAAAEPGVAAEAEHGEPEAEA
jgi:hypothetical protein